MQIKPNILLNSIFSRTATPTELAEMIIFAETLKGLAVGELFAKDENYPNYSEALEKIVLEIENEKLRKNALGIRIRIAREKLLLPRETFLIMAIKRFLNTNDEICLGELIGLTCDIHDPQWAHELLSKATNVKGINYIQTLKPESEKLLKKIIKRLSALSFSQAQI